MIIVQPVNQPNTFPASRLDHWKIAPETGHHAGELGEVQRDEQLPGEDQRPGPEEGRAAEPEAEPEQLEDGGEDGDEGEPRGEGGERPDAPVQLLAVAEAGETLRFGTIFGCRAPAGRRLRGGADDARFCCGVIADLTRARGYLSSDRYRLR